MTKILITGLTGFIGQNLLKNLDSTYRIFALVRRSNASLPSHIRQLSLDDLANLRIQFDCIINLAGENIAAKPWSDNRKHELHASRGGLLRKLREVLQHPPAQIISMSAIGYYGIRNDTAIDETTLPKADFCHSLCADLERETHQFEAQHTSIFRLAVVLGDGGALSKMRPAYLFGLGGKIGTGEQWFSWIHIKDVVNLIILSLEKQLPSDTYNLSTNNPVKQKDFAKYFARSLNRPCFLTTPKWALSLLFSEMATLLTEGAGVMPTKLNEQAYRFEFSNLEDALENLRR